MYLKRSSRVNVQYSKVRGRRIRGPPPAARFKVGKSTAGALAGPIESSVLPDRPRVIAFENRQTLRRLGSAATRTPETGPGQRP
jgi:hypothetical protein